MNSCEGKIQDYITNNYALWQSNSSHAHVDPVCVRLSMWGAFEDVFVECVFLKAYLSRWVIHDSCSHFSCVSGGYVGRV